MENLAQYIDQTLLAPDATKQDIINFCKEAKKYNFYAVCVQPTMVKTAVETLKKSEVKVAAVVGFPCGTTLTEIKMLEALRCLEDGADEIDMVINQGALKEGDYELVREEIHVISGLVSTVAKKNNAKLKVIIETGHLTDEEKIKACQLVTETGAAFVKTSTGVLKSSKPATVEDVKLMHEVVKDFGILVKASGGIKDYKTAKALIEAGAARIGTSAGLQILTGAKTSSETY